MKRLQKFCSILKLGISSVTLDYELIRFAGPPLWHLLHEFYGQFFLNFTVPKSLKTVLILHLFKGKGLKLITRVTTEVLPFSPNMK